MYQQHYDKELGTSERLIEAKLVITMMLFVSTGFGRHAFLVTEGGHIGNPLSGYPSRR